MKFLIICFVTLLSAEDIYQNIKGASHDFSFNGENSCIYCHSSNDMKIEEPSLLCLSCHDGVSSTLSSNNQHSGLQGFTDAGNHPIAIKYIAGGVLKQIQNKDLLKGPNNDMIECTSCHNPHQKKSDQSVNFLRYPMKNSELCYQCHNL